MLLTPAAILGELETSLQFLIFAGIITDAFAVSAFQFDECVL
jgi:hypothetical protein